MKKALWIVWVIISLSLAIYYLFIILLKEDKSELLIGEATYGHYQIEMACSSCHTDPFGGPEILQNACLNCHEQELKNAFDSHPKKKFTDPRNADLISVIDARYCVSCHTEHQHEQTREMGLTLPEDYCFHCHEDIGKERESHKDLEFNSCATAGCHNFHDNRALYEAFLVDNANQPWLKEIALLAKTNHAKNNAQPPHASYTLSEQEIAKTTTSITMEWQDSAHATAGVSCENCHQDQANKQWIERPSLTQCQHCHDKETEGFTSGKHGMRLSSKLSKPPTLSAITPSESHLSFNESSYNNEHSCNSCHASHDFNRKEAAVESCLNCHADDHSLAYKESAHSTLWDQELLGKSETGTGVTCATCHMPRITTKENRTTTVHVEHNQNMNLRPNEKMIRPVCMQCHSLAFSIDALADKNLIKNNFNGKPSVHIESINWALKREKR